VRGGRRKGGSWGGRREGRELGGKSGSAEEPMRREGDACWSKAVLKLNHLVPGLATRLVDGV
jgi:hypothetical protein